MKKTLIALLVVTVVLTFIGCSSRQSGTPSKVESQTPDATSNENNPTPISIWLINSGSNYSSHIEDFAVEHPELDVKLTWFASEDLKTQQRIAVDSGTAPDISVVNAGDLFNEFQSAGAFMDLTNIISENNLDERVSDPSYFNLYTVDGKIFGYPTACLTTWQTLYINKDLFNQCGITGYPKTVSELIEVSKVFKNNGIAPVALGDKDGWPAIILFGDYYAQLSADTSITDAINSGEDKFTENEVIKQAFSTVVKLGKADVFMSGFSSQDHTAAIQTFASGKSAMLYNGSWWTGIAGGTDNGFELDVIQLPLIDGLEDNAAVQLSSDMCAVIFSQTKHLEACTTFLDYLTTEETWIANANDSSAFALYPGANKKVSLDPIFLTDPILKQFDKPAISPFFDWIFPTPVTEVLKTVFPMAIDNRITIDDALAQVQAEMDRNIR